MDFSSGLRPTVPYCTYFYWIQLIHGLHRTIRIKYYLNHKAKSTRLACFLHAKNRRSLRSFRTTENYQHTFTSQAKVHERKALNSLLYIISISNFVIRYYIHVNINCYRQLILFYCPFRSWFSAPYPDRVAVDVSRKNQGFCSSIVNMFLLR